MLHLRRFVLLVLATSTLSACPGEPGALRPLFDEVTGLPAYLVEPDPPPAFQMPIRNIGETAVTITAFRFDDADGAAGQSESFYDLAFDVTEITGGEQAVVGFKYRTPAGAAQAAVLVIESDSTETPTLEIPVSTVEYTAPPGPDGGDEDGGVEDGGVEDAGQGTDGGGGDDAGPSDAGGGDDAGPSDAGGGDDAGPSDAGGGGDAGPSDAG